MSTPTDPDGAEHGSDLWRQRAALTDMERGDFIALRKVCGSDDSSVDKVGSRFYDSEYALLPWVENRVMALVETGYAVIGEPDPSNGNRQRVTVTAPGRARYEQLCERQGIPPYPGTVPDGGASTTPESKTGERCA